MEILWLAIVIYSIGLGLLLHFRPAYMFHENGSWKEFGYQRDSRHTLFPFWLFAIAWAFMSYVLAATVVWSFFTPVAALSVGALNVASRNVASRNVASRNVDVPKTPTEEDEFMMPASNITEEEYGEEDEEEEEEDTDIKDVHIKNRNIHFEDGSAKPSARPGYYIVDPSSKSSGIRRYIYYGPNPPTE